MRSRGFLDRSVQAVATAWVGVFWFACVALPLAALLSRVHHLDSLFDAGVLNTARMTVGQALFSAGISALLGLPLGIWVGSTRLRQLQWAQSLLALPFGVPAAVAGLAWIILLGKTGVFSGLDWAYSFKAVILAHIVFNVPWIALWVAQSRVFLPGSQLEAARTLGAGKLTEFVTLVWPQIRWAFWSSVCQAFVFCAMSFALVLILGGGPPVQTLEVQLYTSIRYGQLDLSRASACAFWELLITLLPWCLMIYFQARDDRQANRAIRDGRIAASGSSRFSSWAAVGVSALFFLPYLGVLAVGKDWASSSAEHALAWDEIVPALKISVILAFLTAVGSLLTAVAAIATIDFLPRKKRWLRAVLVFLMGFPSGISALVLGLGIWLAYGNWIDPFSGSYIAILGLQMAIFFPIAFRVLWPVVRDRPVNQVEAAVLLGASRFRAFWLVEWPRWRGPVLSSLGMVAGASLGEVAAVSLFYNENLITLPLLITRWASQYRFQDAQLVSLLLLFLCCAMILFAYPFTISITTAHGSATKKKS